MSDPSNQQPAPATLRVKGAPPSEAIPTHFNPSSLQYTVQNQVVEQSQGGQANQRKQYVTQTTAKLTMDLIFDTTDTGQNVCNITVRIAQMMRPQTTETSAELRTAPPAVVFEWGDYAFEGMIEQYRETIDFFHPSGVPLRSSINLTLASQELQFEQGGDRSANTSNSAHELPQGSNPQSLATRGGSPRAARAIAARNGQESLRFSRGPLTVSASVQLKGPAGFASGGAGLGASAGFGASAGAGFGASAGASAGFGASAGAGFGASAGAGFGASAGASFGGSASAGVSASSGAFAGLHASASASAGQSYTLNTRNLLPASGTAGLSLSASASFNAAGQASAGAGARVELTADGMSRIIFSTE
ncbi:MAG TPA: hypothetical protein VFS21_22160 [Roseiflexaceae bacterium]|nr:hypothetical protein [Roseiflexaceae bacterium]